MYDIIIIGAGISGSFLANELKNKYNLLIIEKEKSSGGIWYQTKWSWLKSDTKGYIYSPYYNSKDIYDNYFLSGVPRDEILKLTNKYLENQNIKYNEYVIKIEYKNNKWNVYTNKEVYETKWIINSTGLYQKANYPIDIVNYLEKNNIKYIHSSKFDDNKISNYENIAIIGSRESGVQIIKSLSKNKKIDWYARSFNNWYMNVEKSSNFEKLLCCLYILKYIPVIGNLIYIVMSFIKKFVLDKSHDFILNTLINYHKNGRYTKIPEAYYKISPTFRYDYKQPLRPVFTSNLNFNNINNYILNDYSMLKKYDMVILCTGYIANNPYDIYIDGEKQNVDIFYLVDYILPKLPNTIYCLPIAVSSFVMLEEMNKKIKKILDEYIDKKYMITNIEYILYKNKIDKYLSDNNLTREKLCYHTRHPTFIYNSKFI